MSGSNAKVRVPVPVTVKVGLFRVSSLQINLLPSSTTLQLSMVMLLASTMVAPLKTYVPIPLGSALENVALLAIQEQSIPVSSNVTGGAVNLTSTLEPML